MKSDREYLDEIYAKAKIRLIREKKLRNKAIMAKITLITVSLIFVVSGLSFTVWQSSILNAWYQTSKPNDKILSNMGSNIIHALTIEELVLQSDLIIKGTVEKQIGSYWTNPNGILGENNINQIDTYYSVDINQIYKGNQEIKKITLSIPGGQIGNTQDIETYSPLLQTGEQVIIFLNNKPATPPLTFYPYKGSYVVSGFQRGIYFKSQTSDEYVTSKIGAQSPIDPNIFQDEVNKILNK